MKPSRNYVTPFITIIFLAVGLSGVLMCFHLLVGYTEVVHEVLGIFFSMLYLSCHPKLESVKNPF